MYWNFRFSFATCENSFFPALSAQAHREFYEEHFETFLSRRFEGLMEFFGLPMDKPIRSFSTGQKNQFEVIMALSQGAGYILMDEPFVRLDPKAAHTLKTLMREHCDKGGAIFFSTHVLEVAEKLCDKVAIIQAGKLVKYGTMDEVRGDDSLEDTFLELAERRVA